MENELLDSLKTLTRELAQLSDSHSMMIDDRGSLSTREIKRFIFQVSSLANEFFTEIDRVETVLEEQAYYDGE